MAARARRGRDKRADRQREAALLKRLSAALSEEEIRRVLVSALLALDAQGVDQLVARLGTETGGTLRRLLASRDRSEPPRPGRAKVRQEWERAWQEWRACVDASGDEHGPYVHQDEDWEAPYFVASAVAEELEPIALRMRKLLPRVMDDDLDPGFSFAGALVETAQEIGSGLPDWMGDSEGCDFGPQVTSCLIEWERRAAGRNGVGAFELVDRIHDLESSLEEARLDDESVTGFVLGLREAEQKAILEGMAARRTATSATGSAGWEDALRRVHSRWFHLYQELARRWDRSLFAASCLENIARNWELALPLLQNMLRKRTREAFAAALPIIEEAVRALLSLGPGVDWDPRDGLLIRHPTQCHGLHPIGNRVRLLQAWRKVAVGLGQQELASALEIQAITCAKWEDWDAVVKAFRKVQTTADASVCDRLFADWRTQVADASLESSTWESGASERTWLDGLADAARAGDDGASFHAAVRLWLEEIGRTPEAVRRSVRSLGTLTLDLDTGLRLKKIAPALRHLLLRDQEKMGLLARSRRRWVARLRGSELLPEVIELWKRNVATVVPDPARVGSSGYADCVDWMTVVFELDPRAYARIVRTWSEKHKRRRNLWRALAAEQLPVEPSSQRLRVRK